MIDEIKNFILVLVTMGQMGHVEDNVLRKTLPVLAGFGLFGGMFSDTWSQILGVLAIAACASITIHTWEYFRCKSPNKEEQKKSYIEMNDISNKKSKKQ